MKLNCDLSRFRQDGGPDFNVTSQPTTVTPLYENKKGYRAQLGKMRREIDTLQNMMYAHNRYGLLCIFQAMDAAGKDGTIRRVMSGVNPHGVEIHSFKKPSEEELDHDFMWRTTQRFPPRGRIGIFNRSYYEEVLIARVHPEIITQYQRIPSEHTVNIDALWQQRFEDIRSLERYAHRNGIHILKFFLNISIQEQARRLLDRLEKPSKNWKFSEADLEERKFWNQYQEAYQEMINQTSTPQSPWFVVPADDKRNMRLLVASLILEKLSTLDMSYPRIDEARKQKLEIFRNTLQREQA
jgi:PPK2 family polyphosphate:nucleotide phosphotransferase